MTKVVILKIDPYNKNLVLAIPQIMQKFSDVLQQLGDDDNVMATQFFPRLFARDKGVLLLAAIDPDTALVKGFAAAAIYGGDCVMLQPKLDEPTENDAIKEMVELVEDWAKAQDFVRLTMVARRYDAKWNKKHGFEISRYIMTKELE